MANITVSVTDANNITVQLTPVASQTITIDRGVAGNGISSIVPVTISTLQYLRIFYTNGTQQDVGPLTSTAYFGETPITIVGNTIGLSTVPINKGGTNATTAAAAIQNLLPSYTGNGSKRLSLNSGATALEWVLDGGGTVTSVDVSGGTTGLTTSGGPITGSGTIILAGTLNAVNGGTGQSIYAIGDLLYASSTTALSKLADVATGNALISGGVSTAPSWGKIGLTTHVSGTLPTTNGGTGLTSFTANGIVYASSTSALATGSALTFDGATLSANATRVIQVLRADNARGGSFYADNTGTHLVANADGADPLLLEALGAGDIRFRINSSEKMRLTSTGLGIGTSSPTNLLSVAGNANITGNTTLGDASTDTVTVNGTLGIGGAASASKAIYVQNSISGLNIIGTDLRGTYTSTGGSLVAALATGGGGGLVANSGGAISAYGCYFSEPNVTVTSGSVTNAATVFINEGPTEGGTLNANLYTDAATGTNKWNIYASGTAANYFAGNVGIGTSSPAYKLDVNSTGAATIRIARNAGTDANTGIQFNLATTYWGVGVGSDDSFAITRNTLAFNASTTFKIDSSGNLLVGMTSTSGQSGVSIVPASATYTAIHHANGSASGAEYALFRYNGSGIGSITQNGTTGVLYNLTSDYRLKNDQQALTGAKDFIMALKPKKWQWWDGSGEGVGFVAHEFMEVAKYSGNGEKDAVDSDGKPVYQSIQPSSSEVMANLVAFIQEQQAIITQLTARITALEGA